jgi:hypothetical protein
MIIYVTEENKQFLFCPEAKKCYRSNLNFWKWHTVLCCIGDTATCIIIGWKPSQSWGTESISSLFQRSMLGNHRQLFSLPLKTFALSVSSQSGNHQVDCHKVRSTDQNMMLVKNSTSTVTILICFSFREKRKRHVLIQAGYNTKWLILICTQALV